jgi:subtilisin family serine protease
MKRILNGSILIAMVALVLAACGGGGGGGGGQLTPPAPPTLTSISLSPSNPNLALNALLHLTIVGNYSNGTTANLYGAASWVSSASAVVAVDSTGAVTPAGTAGQSASISATYGTLTASTTVTLAAALPTYTVATVNDPLAAEQWGLRNTAQFAYSDTSGVANTGTLGTDIHVDSVYSTYGNTGAGVTVAVVDSGLEIAHEDLSANVVVGGSWDFANNDTDPTSAATTGDHGTSVSGLIAMQKGNSIGGMGVAPSAKLKGFNFLSPAAGYVATSIELAQSLGGSSASPNSTDVDVFNQSFGTGNVVDFPVDAIAEAQYAYGVTNLRGGKGALYVKSAGNGFSLLTYVSGGFLYSSCGYAIPLGVSCQNANFDPSNTLPYNIVVAALNAKGKKSSYSTAGSAVWMSTPGGEYGYNVATAGSSASWPATIYDPAMVTADQTGCTNGYSKTAATASAFNKGGTNLASINLNCNYANTMNGTSSAAPMMSGVIALILEANPSLTWRDVKDILAKTAVQVDTAITPVTVTLGNGLSYTAEQAWVTNAAGFKFHNWYGFGAVDAAAAVAMARTYVPGAMGSFASTGWLSSGTLSVAIPDNSTVGASVGLTVPKVGSSGKVETVQIMVTTAAASSPTSTGDLGIELTSPSGTKSILKNIRDGFIGNNLNGMVLASNAFYGENSTGNWTVKVVDGIGAWTQTLTNVQIRVYGH